MIIDFKYGDSIQSVNVPDKNLIGILSQNEDMPLCKETEESIILNALNNPIGSKRLKDIVKPNSKVIIVTSDITRPLPTYKVMPAILDELYSAGISKTDITLVFALGSHRTHTEEEKRKLAGDWVYSEIECIDSDSKDIIRLGTTKRGTPVDIMRKVAQADYRICLGNIEFHYFAGFSGGAKQLCQEYLLIKLFKRIINLW